MKEDGSRTEGFQAIFSGANANLYYTFLLSLEEGASLMMLHSNI
jgi:hypothetical protein